MNTISIRARGFQGNEKQMPDAGCQWPRRCGHTGLKIDARPRVSVMTSINIITVRFNMSFRTFWQRRCVGSH